MERERKGGISRKETRGRNACACRRPDGRRIPLLTSKSRGETDRSRWPAADFDLSHALAREYCSHCWSGRCACCAPTDRCIAHCLPETYPYFCHSLSALLLNSLSRMTGVRAELVADPLSLFLNKNARLLSMWLASRTSPTQKLSSHNFFNNNEKRKRGICLKSFAVHASDTFCPSSRNVCPHLLLQGQTRITSAEEKS
jgi:hypothetical protein